jgi:hypothetical protein
LIAGRRPSRVAGGDHTRGWPLFARAEPSALAVDDELLAPLASQAGRDPALPRWPIAEPDEVITMAVRWDFRYRLSAADVRDLLAEREIDVSA